MIITGSALDNLDLSAIGSKGVLEGPDFSRSLDTNMANGLAELHKFYQIDAYVEQSINKYVDLVLKGGITLSSEDPKAAEWLTERLWMMCWLNGQSMEEWYRSITLSLVQYANVFLLRYRTRKETDLESAKSSPIAGYYTLPTERTSFVLDSFKRIKAITLKDEQGIYGLSAGKAWPASRVLHLYYNRPPGGVLGFSHLFPVLEDIRILRMLEDIVVEMVYKNINPIIHARVGAGNNIPGGGALIKKTDELLAHFNPHSGYLVTNQFTELDVHGSESRALRVEGLLHFFRERVMAGLGVSEISLGAVGSGNRASSETVTSEMVDRAEVYRDHLRQLETSVFFELLYEGGFNPVNKPEHRVRLEYRELNPSQRIKVENHNIQEYIMGVKGLNEVRKTIGLEPADSKTGVDDTYHKRLAELGTKVNPQPNSSGGSNVGQPRTSA